MKIDKPEIFSRFNKAVSSVYFSLCQFWPLQTDGYEAYDDFDAKEGIVHLHCMAHARRYFVEAWAPTDKGRNMPCSTSNNFMLWSEAAEHKELSFDQRKEIRHKEAVRILEHLGRWMKEEQAKVLPKSPIGKALTCSLKR